MESPQPIATESYQYPSEKKMAVSGFHGKVLVEGRLWASGRTCQKIPQCSTEPVTASSKTHPPLAKAEPVSDGGSASVMTYLRSRKNSAVQQQLEERRENM